LSRVPFCRSAPPRPPPRHHRAPPLPPTPLDPRPHAPRRSPPDDGSRTTAPGRLLPPAASRRALRRRSRFPWIPAGGGGTSEEMRGWSFGLSVLTLCCGTFGCARSGAPADTAPLATESPGETVTYPVVDAPADVVLWARMVSPG